MYEYLPNHICNDKCDVSDIIKYHHGTSPEGWERSVAMDGRTNEFLSVRDRNGKRTMRLYSKTVAMEPLPDGGTYCQVYDQDGNIQSTERKDADGIIVSKQKADEDGNLQDVRLPKRKRITATHTIPVMSPCLEPDSDVEETEETAPSVVVKKRKALETTDLPVIKKLKDVPESEPFWFPVDNDKMPMADELYERFNKNRLKFLMKNNLTDSTLKKGLNIYWKKCYNKDKDLARVEYTYSKYSINNSGRLFAKYGVGLQCFPRDVRAFLSADYYVDIDQVNSLPTILSHVFKQYDITCPELDQYVADRAAILKKHHIIKQDVVAMLLNGNYEPSIPFFRRIHRAIYGSLVRLLQRGNTYFSTLWTHLQSVRQTDIKKNREGSFVSLVMQTLENQALQKMKEFFTSEGYSVDVLVFDGLQIRKDPIKQVTQEVLDRCRDYVKEHTEFDIPLAIKPMEVSKEFIEKYQLDKAEIAEESGDQGVLYTDYWSTLINELEGWEKFDYKAFISPTHVSMARWFLWLKNSVIKKHTSGVVWVLGRNNIWQMAQDIQKTDLRLQICDAIMTSAEELVSLVSTQVETEEARTKLHFYLDTLRGMCETATWLKQVADMVYITCPEDDTCIDDFLSKPHLVAFTDCVYDLNTGAERPIQPDDFVIHTTGYPFPRVRRPEVRADIEKFYSDIFPSPEIKKYRLLVVARCLFGRLLEEVFHVLKGEGRNGKGTEDTLIRAVFGAYYYFISQKNLTKSATEPDKPNSQMYNCFARRYLASSESTKGDKFVSETIKGMSGNDPFPVRTLHGKPITFPFTGGLNISTNDAIQFDTVGTSVAERHRMVRYPYSFVAPQTDLDEEDSEMEVDDEEEDEEDRGLNASFEKPLDVTLKTKFQSKEYRDEFMLMLLDLYKEELRPTNNLKIKPPSDVMLDSKRLLAHSMSCSKWFQRHYTITGNTNDRVERTILYGDYE
ncbi:hypothetical protein HK104_007986, partial [Borealophlyctis nickersoniae]